MQKSCSVLELRQKKNNSTESRCMPVLRLPLFFTCLYSEEKSAAVSKLTCIWTPSSRSYIVLALDTLLKIFVLFALYDWPRQIFFGGSSETRHFLTLKNNLKEGRTHTCDIYIRENSNLNRALTIRSCKTLGTKLAKRKEFKSSLSSRFKRTSPEPFMPNKGVIASIFSADRAHLIASPK